MKCPICKGSGSYGVSPYTIPTSFHVCPLCNGYGDPVRYWLWFKWKHALFMLWINFKYPKRKGR